MKSKRKSIQLINQINNLILKKKLLQPFQIIFLGISGGQDSIFLLITFYILKKQWNFKLTIICFNHLWIQNSFYIYLQILKISFSLKIDLFYSMTLKNINSEEKSRYWRLKSNWRSITFKNSSIVLTGHTLTDKIETYFFNTSRGSNINGSSSLKTKKKFCYSYKNKFFISEYELKIYFYKKKSILFNKNKIKNEVSKGNKNLLKKYITNLEKKTIQILEKKDFLIIEEKSNSLQVIRPLIIKTRFDTKNIISHWKLPLFIDETNEKNKYSRNRLRNQIIPTFRFFLNPKVDLSIYRHTEISIEDKYNTDKLIKKLIKIIINEDINGYFINLYFLCSLPLSIQKKIFLLFFKERLNLHYDFSKIDFFVININKFYKILKKEKKINFSKNKIIYIFFPEIGTIFFSKNLLFLLK